MKKALLILGFILSTIITNAKSFNQLSSVVPISLSYKSDTEGFKNIQLLLVNKNEVFDSIPVALEIEVAGEIMIDYFTLGRTFNENVKTLFIQIYFNQIAIIKTLLIKYFRINYY